MGGYISDLLIVKDKYDSDSDKLQKKIISGHATGEGGGGEQLGKRDRD